MVEEDYQRRDIVLGGFRPVLRDEWSYRSGNSERRPQCQLEKSFHLPNLQVIDPDRARNEKAEPAFHRMGKTFGAMMGNNLAIEAQAHFIAFGDEHQFMPLGVSFPRHVDLLHLQ